MTTKQRASEQSAADESTEEREAPGANDQRDQHPQSEAELQEFLEQQITQAIEPVLADFRAQMTQAVQQEMEHAFSGGREGESGDGQAPGAGDIESEVVERRATPEQRDDQTAERKEQSAEGSEDDHEDSHGDSQPRSDAHSAQSLPAKLTQRLQPVPSTLVHGLEHKLGDWLQSLVLAGLTTALSEATRAAIQGAAEKGLDALLQHTFDALPESSNKAELQTQTTRTLHSILGDVFDAVYAEEVRNELQSHGEKAATCLIKRDMDGALDAVRQALQRVGEEIVSVLRRQWQKVLRLMLKLIMAAIDSSLPGDDQDKLPDSSQKRGEKEAAGKK